MSTETKNIISHAFLAVSSGWALSQCLDLPFAAVGFGIYLVNGVLGVAAQVLKNGDLRQIQFRVYRVTYYISFPLITTELYLWSGLPEPWQFLHIIVPVYAIVAEELLSDHAENNLVDINNICEVVSSCYSSFNKDKDIYGFAFSIFELISYFGLKNHRIPEFCFCSGLGCVAALFALKGPQF